MKIFKIVCLIISLSLFTGILASAEKNPDTSRRDSAKKEKKKAGKKVDEKAEEKDKAESKPKEKAEEKNKEKETPDALRQDGAALREKDKAKTEEKDKVKANDEVKEKKEEEKNANIPWAETYQEIKNRLETVKMSFDLKDKTIFEAVEYFQDALLIRFRISSKVYSEYNTKTVSVALKNVQAKMALRLSIEMYDLKCLYEDGALFIMAPDETVVGEYVTVIYRIDDLLAPPPEDFKSPQIDSNLQTASGVKWPDPPDIGVREKKIITKEEIEEAIKTQTDEKLWQDTKKVSITVTSRFLVITHTKSMHKKIIEILNTLRAEKR